MHQIGRRPQAGLLLWVDQLRAPQPLPATLPLGYLQPLPALDIDLGSGRRVSAPIGVDYLAVAGNHASVVGPKGELAALLDTQVRHDVESAHLTPQRFMPGLRTAPEKLPPVDGPARLFVEHPPAGEGPGRHERRIPLRLGDPSTVHHFDGTRPRAANDFEWDRHHALASPPKIPCSKTAHLTLVRRSP